MERGAKVVLGLIALALVVLLGMLAARAEQPGVGYLGGALEEGTTIQLTRTGVLKVDQESLEQLLRNSPESKLRIAVFHYDKQTDDWVPNEPTSAEAVEWIRKVMAGTVTCLDKMEAAMRAMEDNSFLLNDGHYRSELKRGVFLLVMTKEEIEQWESVKRACWRQP